LPEERPTIDALAPADELARAARSGDTGVRARALQLQIEAGGSADPALEDGADWVRGAAIDALVRRADPEARALLERVALDASVDAFLRGRAAVGAPGPATAAAMARAAAEADPWRAAPFALAAVRLGDAGARPALIAALQGGEIPLDLTFVRDLAQSGDRELIPALRRAEEAAEPELALPLAAARLALEDVTAEVTLRKALADASTERRLEAVDVLVEVEGEAATALLRRAQQGGPEMVTVYAELALAARGAADTGALVRVFSDGDRELRELAAQLAARAPGDRRAARDAQRAVTAALADADGAVRAAGARAAGERGLAGAEDALRLLLGDEHERVRVEAAGALLRLERERTGR
jgi:HEAT repeat protein